MKRFLIIFAMAFVTMLTYAKAPEIHVAQFFDGRYNKEKSVRTTISRDNGVYYRGMQVNDNAPLVNLISETLQKDAPQATKYLEQTGAGGTSVWIKLTNNGETIDIGLQQAPSGKNAYLFIKGPEKAFK